MGSGPPSNHGQAGDEAAVTGVVGRAEAAGRDGRAEPQTHGN
jgi:hypothetical protein